MQQLTISLPNTKIVLIGCEAGQREENKVPLSLNQCKTIALSFSNAVDYYECDLQ